MKTYLNKIKKIQNWFAVNDLNKRRKIFYIGLLFLVYSPTYLYTFAYFNDYWRFRYLPLNLFFDETGTIAAIGRPLGAFLLNLQLYFVRSMFDFQISRFATVLIIAINYLILLKILNKNNWPRKLTPIISLSIFLLPTSQISVIWATQMVPIEVVILLVSIAFLLLNSELYGNTLWFIGFMMLVSAFLIYPPNAFYFLTLSMTGILSPDTDYHNLKSKTKSLLQNILLIISVSFLYFIYIKYVNMWLSLAVVDFFGSIFIQANHIDIPNKIAAQYALSINLDIWPKILLIKSILLEHFSLWWRGYFVFDYLVFWLFLFLSFLIRFKNKDKGRLLFFQTFGVILVFFLMNSPQLLTAHDVENPEFGLIFGGYRMMFSTQSLVAVFLFSNLISLNKIGKFLVKYIIAGFLFVIFVLSIHGIYYSSINLKREYDFLYNEINSINFNKIKEIAIYEHKDPGHAILVRESFLTMERAIMVHPGGSYDIVRQILREQGMNQDQIQKIKIIYINYVDIDRMKNEDSNERASIYLENANYFYP